MGVCSAGLSTTQLPVGQGRGEFPGGHQERKIPRDDGADDAERLVEMIGNRVRVDLRQGAFLSADAAGEIAEMIDGERQVGRGRLADRFTVVATLDEGQKFLAAPPSGRRSC